MSKSAVTCTSSVHDLAALVLFAAQALHAKDGAIVLSGPFGRRWALRLLVNEVSLFGELLA